MFNNVFREHDSLSEKRKHQIDTLKIFNDNVTEVIKDVEYKVEFDCGGRLMALSVCLGPKFPLDKPILNISPPVNHPWIKQHNEISLAPGLLNFTVHSDLGRVVQAVVREFVLRPPPLIEKSMQQTTPQGSSDESTSPSTSGVPTNNYMYSATTTSALPFNNYTYCSTSLTSSPSQPMSLMFPELNKMTVPELKELNENPQRLDELVNLLPTKQALNRNLDEWISTVENLAKENLKWEPEIAKLRVEVEEKLEMLREAKNDYDKYIMEYRKLCERFNPLNIRESLQQSVVRVDEESERVAEMFLAADIDLDSFLTQYIGHRMISYSRKAKDEKLSQQLEKLHQAGF